MAAAAIFSVAVFAIGAWVFVRIGRHSRLPVEKVYAGKSGSQKRPIVLVHGLNRTGRIWMVADDGHGNRSSGAGSMVEFLRENGYPNIYINTFPDTRNTSLFGNANRLKEWIEETKKRFRAKTVDIVAHSLGGLIARAYLQEMSRNDDKTVNPVRYGKDVKRLIMIAIPHLGSPLADPFASVLDWYAPRTLREGGGPDLRFLNQMPLPCRPKYYSIVVSISKQSSRRGWRFWRVIRFLLSFSAPLDGDGTVSLKSQNLKNAVPLRRCSANPHKAFSVKLEPPFRHRDAARSPSVQKIVLKILNGQSEMRM
ncbi:MAG: alpha/beta hydrolase [Nitrospinota bacterium]